MSQPSLFVRKKDKQPGSPACHWLLTARNTMAQISESVARVIDEFARLPGIGRK
jgi:hypothetical protein